jgi:hypothetical protein
LISAIGAGVRGLVHPRPRKGAAEEAAGPQQKRGARGRDAGASWRYPMDAGVTGALTLLLDRSDPRRRR